jgi:hypothetical protein
MTLKKIRKEEKVRVVLWTRRNKLAHMYETGILYELICGQILVDRLGKGAYGVVFKAINLYEGNTVAIKKLNLKGCSKEVIDSLNAEIDLLKSLDHENIVRYIDNIQGNKGKELNIVMEYVVAHRTFLTDEDLLKTVLWHTWSRNMGGFQSLLLKPTLEGFS